jgi:hypothetical protein
VAVNWTESQRARVQRVLSRHPIESNRCENAARSIVTIGREREPAAQVWRLYPVEGIYVVPKVKVGPPYWREHFTVEVEAHCVDALTRVDGCPRASYLDDHWTETDALRWEPR